MGKKSVIAKFAQSYRQAEHERRVVYISLMVLSSLLLYLIFGYIVGSIWADDEHGALYYGLFGPNEKGVPITMFGVSGLILFAFVTFLNELKKLKDEEKYKPDAGTYGSSRWLKEEEIARSFNLEDIQYTFETIYGQVTENGEKVVSFKPNQYGSEGNRNVLMIATMGTGKSYSYVRTELIQAALRNNSFVVTDPSAELYTDLSLFMRNRGIDVKVLNLADAKYSDFWNVLSEVIDPTTERIEAKRLNAFARVFMKNSAPDSGAKEDPFFVPAAENLLKAVIGYTAYNREGPIIEEYANLYETITGEKNDAFLITLRGERTSEGGALIKEPKHIGFPLCRKIILEAAEERHMDIKKVKKLLKDIENTAPKQDFNIATVYDNLKFHTKEMKAYMKTVPNSFPAKSAWITYDTSAKDDVKAQIAQGLQLRMSLLDDDVLREAISHDGVNIRDINKKQSAYFVIMSDTDATTKPIASLFFTFLFKDAQENWDKAAQMAKEKGIENPCLPLVTMLDEFFSIGVIGGSADEFGVTMSNSRKRKIYISIILQVYSQLESLYGKHIADVIQGGCDTLLYLGGNDPSTCQFVSEFVSGEATIETESYGEAPGSARSSEGKRFVLTKKEANMWKDKVLVSKRGELPLKLNPFPWVEHPAHTMGYTQPQSIYSSVKPIEEKLEELELTSRTKVKTEDELQAEIKDIMKDSYIDISKPSKSIVTYESFVVDEETGEVLDYISPKEPTPHTEEPKPQSNIDKEEMPVSDEDWLI